MTNPRPLGLWSATALVVGSIIGSGVFLLPASLAPYGAVSLAGWAITLFGAVMLALTFAKLSTRWPKTGGPYAFARAGFGDLAGFVIAWSYWISTWTTNAAISVAFAGSIGSIFPALTSTPLRSAACALAALWTCIAINLAGVREVGRAQVVLTVLKFVPLLVFGGIAIWFIDGSHYQPTRVAGETLPHAINATVALTLWALLGLEAATIPAGSIANPERTVPRATVLGTMLAGLATILACSAVLGLLPAAQLAASPAPMADAARSLWGPAAGAGIAAVAAVSCLGALNGWVLISAQIPMAAARDGVMPSMFARLDSRGTPAAGVLIAGTLSTLLVFANFSKSLVQLFTFAILLATAATLLPYVVSSATWLRRGDGSGRVVASLALLYSLYALVGIGTESLLWGVVLVAAGLPVFWLVRRRTQGKAAALP